MGGNLQMKDILSFLKIDTSPEAVAARNKKRFEEANSNLENMSYWLPKIFDKFNQQSALQIPDTKIVKLTQEQWEWLTSDRYTPEDIAKFDEELKSEINEFLDFGDLFMKTGVFSNKFNYTDTQINKEDTIGKKFLNMFYQSMIVGAANTAEVVVRINVPNVENRTTIYEGMPLRTEFRVFYDFDKKEVVGVSNYWHPEIMESRLQEEDLSGYLVEKETIITEYNALKGQVSEEVSLALSDVTELTGRWSVDVMKNGEEFWLIDMARMEVSALVGQMETL